MSWLNAGPRGPNTNQPNRNFPTASQLASFFFFFFYHPPFPVLSFYCHLAELLHLHRRHIFIHIYVPSDQKNVLLTTFRSSFGSLQSVIVCFTCILKPGVNGAYSVVGNTGKCWWENLVWIIRQHTLQGIQQTTTYFRQFPPPTPSDCILLLW